MPEECQEVVVGLHRREKVQAVQGAEEEIDLFFLSKKIIFMANNLCGEKHQPGISLL